MATFVAAIDFGTANSGVVWGRKDASITSDFFYVNKGFQRDYAKTRTALLIHVSLLEHLTQLKDNDLKIYGIVHSDVMPNLYFGDEAEEFRIVNARKQRDAWVYFEYFKMNLYHTPTPEDAKVKGSDGKHYNLTLIIGLFLRCLKLSTLHHMHAAFHHADFKDDITWGVTIPTIWEREAKTIMGKASRMALGVDPIFILEPEGAAMSFTSMNAPDCPPTTLRNRETFIVIDCGGGTTDIVAQEVILTDGTPHYEEVTSAKGRAAAGADMDRRFWALLADRLAKEEPSIREPYTALIDAFRFDAKCSAGWSDLTKVWLRIKHAGNALKNNGHIEFEFPAAYLHWLTAHYPSIVNRYSSDFGLIVDLTYEDLLQKVFEPVIKDILEVAQESARPCKRLNFVFLAGGLSGLPELQEAVKAQFAQSHRSAKFVCEAIYGQNRVLPGGSILRGAACLLVYDKYIRRVAKRNYYYTTFIAYEDYQETLLSFYETFDLSVAEEKALKTGLKADEKKYPAEFDNNQSNKKMIKVYYPICLRDRKAPLFQTCCSPLTHSQRSLQLNIYSSEQSLFIPRTDDIHIREEGMVEFSCTGDDVFDLEVDFNEFQQEYIKMVIKDQRTGKFKGDIPIKPEIGIGH